MVTMVIKTRANLALAFALTTAPVTAFADGTNRSGSASDDMLLLDSMGRVVKVPTNEVPSELQPPANVGLTRLPLLEAMADLGR
jgi:hypothetical protein